MEPPKNVVKNYHQKRNSILKFIKNTINSLNEVECFLNNFKKFSRYVRLYKIFK